MRSLGSVPANIAEGYGRGEVMPKDKSQRYFQTIANGSLCEFTAWLDIAVIHNVITNVDANHLKDIAKRLSDMIIDDACKPKYLGVNL